MAILVTGGAGYIGSHTCVELLTAGYDVVVLDNLSNSDVKVLPRLRKITGRDVRFYEGDILDSELLEELLSKEDITACIHFAGLKAVGESVAKPLSYYKNNVGGTLTLLEKLAKHGAKKLIFSSSATVYGKPASVPITEQFPRGECTNPYGRTKSMIEEILIDLCKADPEWSVVLLRYFNPVGAHESGLIGENPRGIPNNLMPYVTQVATRKLRELGVFGDDYDTPDGTGVRDYIHVVDLAKGHLAALAKLGCEPEADVKEGMKAEADLKEGIEAEADEKTGLGGKAEAARKSGLQAEAGCSVYNLGTGNGYSVLDLVKAFEKATGVEIPYVIKPRRPGDIDMCYCDPSKALRELGWKAEKDLLAMCADAWNWQKNNPEGY